MPIAAPTAHLPLDASDDIEYVRSSFRPMEDAVRPLVERGVLPQASYVLPDGTPMVPADHDLLLKDAGATPTVSPLGSVTDSSLLGVTRKRLMRSTPPGCRASTGSACAAAHPRRSLRRAG
jgi:hypothetical protein